MVDMHTHIIPNLDDGAQTTQISLQMLDKLAQDGVRHIVLTPHFYFSEQSMEGFLKKRNSAFQKLCEIAPDNLKLHLGAEVEFSNVSIDFGVLRELAIDNGNYILLELPFFEDYNKGIIPKLESFICRNQLTPIIAHAERYKSLQKHPSLVYELINMGCLIQINASSVIASKSGSFIDALLKHGQAHILGTDCHNMTSRKPEYKMAIDIISDRYGKECRDFICEISKDVIEGKRVQLSADLGIKRIFGVYR